MIDHLFPIPIGIYERPVKITNKELNFLENLKRRKNESNYTSVNDYILQCAELKDLYKFLKECLEDYVAQTIAPDQKQLQFYVTQSWSNYTKSGEYHQMHKHQNSIVSGVFYPQVDEHDNITYRNYDETAGTQMPLHIEPVSFNRYNSATWKYPVKVGQLYLFPSSLQHCVETRPDNKEATRISISFNSWCEGQLGDPKQLNSLNLTKEARYDFE
tara:strand:+ start:1684 stop:2328 length:645 start_codon:yes stop_codon:yes gene_type:complete